MSEKQKTGGKKPGSTNAVASEVILMIMIVFVVGLISFTAGQMTAGKNIFFMTQAPEAAPDIQRIAVTEKTDNSPVLAIVDGNKITRDQVFELVNSMPPQMQQLPSEQLVTLAMEQVINNSIISAKADNARLDNDPEVQQQLARIKEQLVRARFVETEVDKQLTEDRVRDAYKEYVKNFPDMEEVKAAHILVADEASAKELIKKLDQGADFAALAKESSTDGTAENGGDLGYFVKTDVVPEFAEAAFSTPKGSYTKAPVKTDFGYHIIKVEDKRKRPPADFMTAKPYLEQELRRGILDEIVTKWRAEADIERFDLNGNPVVIPPGGEQESLESRAPAAGDESPENGEAAQ